MIVYRAINIKNGKQYIGYTTRCLDERKKEHLYKSRSNSSNHYYYLFKQAIRKYGIDSFKWEILETCTSVEECCIKEIYYIDKYKTISPNGYNLTIGGNGGIQSKETKLKISESVKKYWQINKEKNSLVSASKETRKEWAKKSWQTKKKKGYISPAYSHKEESKLKMSLTKNKNNKIEWTNEYTLETINLSLTDMAKRTGLSIGVFNHLKHGRQIKTKCGWKLLNLTNGKSISRRN
jgi:group I intron endonuclease